ncbi:MAG: hypothetical protein NTX05_04440 [Fusobacteria bacterium]|nr:hypothetical protein [Fusobacteriota bacterium]
MECSSSDSSNGGNYSSESDMSQLSENINSSNKGPGIKENGSSNPININYSIAVISGSVNVLIQN